MYSLYIIPSAGRDLDRLDKKILTQIKGKILSLSSNPRPPQCVKLTADQGYRLRSGDYRILYRIDDKQKRIYIYRIKHRKESYRRL